MSVSSSKATTREAIANELGVSSKKLRNWMKERGITIPRGLVTPEYKRIIIDHWEGRRKSD